MLAKGKHLLSDIRIRKNFPHQFLILMFVMFGQIVAAATLSPLATSCQPHKKDGNGSSLGIIMTHETYPDDLIRSILKDCRRIAIVGASDNPARPSYFVFKYLTERNYDVIPVNPARAGQMLLGKPFVSSLAQIEGPLDMVEIFRNSEAAMGVTEEALNLSPLPKVLWMQLGVRNDEAAALAEAQGLTVIMNRCPKIEYGRLSGEIAWMGVNSRTLSSKRPQLSTKGFQKLTIDRRQ